MHFNKVSQVCAVCDEYSDQVERHYDCLLCNGCRAFFKREVHNKRQLSNCRHGNQCLITVETRTRCKSCRWKACLRAKANIHKVQRENSNNTRRKRSSPDPDGSNADDRESIREHNLGHPLLSVHQAATYSQSSSTVLVNGQSPLYPMSLWNSHVNAMHHPSVSGMYHRHPKTYFNVPPMFSRYHYHMVQTPLQLRSLDLNQPQHLAQRNLQVNGHYQPPNSASGFSFDPGYIPNVPFNISSELAGSFVFNPPFVQSLNQNQHYQMNNTSMKPNDPNISLLEEYVNDTTLRSVNQSLMTNDENDVEDGENIDVETSFSEHEEDKIDVESPNVKVSRKPMEYDNKSFIDHESDSAEDYSIIDNSSSSSTHLYITKSIKPDTIISLKTSEPQQSKNANNFMIDRLLGDIIHNSSSTVEQCFPNLSIWQTGRKFSLCTRDRCQI